MATILIVYLSRSGNTRAMADEVAEGVKAGGAAVKMQPVAEASVDDLLQAQGVILGSPTYYGGMSAELKRYIDESVKYHGKLIGKVGGAFTSAGGLGGGNETTVLDMIHALLIHGMVVPGNVAGDHYGAIAVGEPDQRSKEQCRAVGKLVAELAVKLHG